MEEDNMLADDLSLADDSWLRFQRPTAEERAATIEQLAQCQCIQFSMPFVGALHDAQQHLQAVADQLDVQIDWLTDCREAHGPVIEHVSFICKNRVYFVQVVDNSGAQSFPGGSEQDMRRIAREWGGISCWMPMRDTHDADGMLDWEPVIPGWGLLNVADEEIVNPAAMGLAEPPAMTTWELHDDAVRRVREKLEGLGRTVISWSSDPSVEPAIWIAGKEKQEFVVVDEQVHPALAATPWQDAGRLGSLRQLAGENRGWRATVVFHASPETADRASGVYRNSIRANISPLRPLPAD